MSPPRLYIVEIWTATDRWEDAVVERDPVKAAQNLGQRAFPADGLDPMSDAWRVEDDMGRWFGTVGPGEDPLTDRHYSRVGAEWLTNTYPALDDGSRWNGWAVPLVPRYGLELMIADVNAQTDLGMTWTLDGDVLLVEDGAEWEAAKIEPRSGLYRLDLAYTFEWVTAGGD
jgi:hypothetical protein